MLLDTCLFFLFCIIAINFGPYTLLLRVFAQFRKVEHTIDADYLPSVTILIAAFNEDAVLQEKLENSLALDYPKAQLHIIVMSDGSTDNTEEIAKQFEQRGITLIANPINRGKSTTLNIGMQNITSDLVVFSDANVMYDGSAIRKLVRHFADPTIGAVSGKVVLLNDGLSYSNAENAYYLLEHTTMHLESQTGNLIGADGAMYALRRELYRPLHPDTLLDDFVLSMGVIQQGKRLILDQEALGLEKNLAEIKSEYRRKVRIVAGGIQSLKRKTIWPPKGNLLTTIKLICHKVMRWLIGPAVVLFILLYILRSIITDNLMTVFFLASAIVIGSLATVILTRLFPSPAKLKFIHGCEYLLVMVAASVVGCYKGLLNHHNVSWR